MKNKLAKVLVGMSIVCLMFGTTVIGVQAEEGTGTPPTGTEGYEGNIDVDGPNKGENFDDDDNRPAPRSDTPYVPTTK